MSKAHFWNVYKELINEWVLFYNATTENSQKVAMGNYQHFLVENKPLFDLFFQDTDLWK